MRGTLRPLAVNRVPTPFPGWNTSPISDQQYTEGTFLSEASGKSRRSQRALTQPPPLPGTDHRSPPSHPKRSSDPQVPWHSIDK